MTFTPATEAKPFPRPRINTYSTNILSGGTAGSWQRVTGGCPASCWLLLLALNWGWRLPRAFPKHLPPSARLTGAAVLAEQVTHILVALGLCSMSRLVEGAPPGASTTDGNVTPIPRDVFGWESLCPDPFISHQPWRPENHCWIFPSLHTAQILDLNPLSRARCTASTTWTRATPRTHFQTQILT